MKNAAPPARLRRGRMVVLEGGEGTGKSTQAGLLAENLGALLTREPGGTPVGEGIRRLLLDPANAGISPRAEALLLLAARAEHVAAVIEPALRSGRDVVCDRFSGSTLAYQGWGRGLPVEELRELSGWAAAGREPDLVVLLTVPAALAAARLAARGSTDRIEGAGAEFFGRVVEGFEALAAAEPERWVTIDGEGPEDQVAERIASVVASRLG